MMLARKRPHSPDSVDEHCCRPNQCNPKYVLESESPLPTDEDSEEFESVQLAATASPKDTSDTSSDPPSDSTDSVTMEVEFELADSQSDEKLLTNCDSSGTDDLIHTAAVTSSVIVAAELWDKDKDLWADSSNMDSSSGSSSSCSTVDSEVPRSDYWECTRCKSKCTPLSSYCRKCFVLRKGYLPERPKRAHPRRRKRPKELPRKSVTPCSDRVANMPGALGKVDSGISVDTCETASVSPCMDSGEPSQEILESKALVKPPALVKDESDEGFPELPKALCFMCLSQPRNGGFVHKRTVHVLCCYQCSVKTWNRTRKCPMCQKRAQNVARIMYG